MIAPWVVILLTVLTAVAVYFTHTGFRAEIDHALVIVKTGNQALIRDYILGYGVWAPVVSIAILIAQAVIVGIPASIVMFANGVAFGTGNGAVINILGRIAGAAITFGIARMLGKGAVEKLVGKLTQTRKFERWMQRRGGWAVFATRAVPGMPSDMLSYVAGFTNVSWKTYLIATLFGFLPQSIVFAWFGAEATEWFWLIMMSGTILTCVLAVTALIVQWVRRLTGRPDATSEPVPVSVVGSGTSRSSYIASGSHASPGTRPRNVTTRVPMPPPAA
jgi:uncharacterized membrane protein YdjX (TVP38/TMEM64 family)